MKFWSLKQATSYRIIIFNKELWNHESEVRLKYITGIAQLQIIAFRVQMYLTYN